MEIPIHEAQALVRNPNSGLTYSQQRELLEDLHKATKARKYARYTGFKPSEQQDDYINDILDEIAGPMPQPGDPYYIAPFQSEEMRIGTEMEPVARKWLEEELGDTVRECGLIIHQSGKFAASPDGIRVSNGTPVEIKCPKRKTLINWWRKGEKLPTDHKAQCHGHMVCTETDSCLFLAYSPWERIRSLVVEVRRDEFTDALEKELNRFCEKLQIERKKMNL